MGKHIGRLIWTQLVGVFRGHGNIKKITNMEPKSKFYASWIKPPLFSFLTPISSNRSRKTPPKLKRNFERKGFDKSKFFTSFLIYHISTAASAFYSIPNVLCNSRDLGLGGSFLPKS